MAQLAFSAVVLVAAVGALAVVGWVIGATGHGQGESHKASAFCEF